MKMLFKRLVGGYWDILTPIALIAIFVLPFALAGAFVNNADRRLANSSVGWPSTGGEVTKPRPDQDDEFTYTYHVNDQPFTSKRLSFGSATVPSDLQADDGHTVRMPAGTRVIVYYDPDDPEMAVLFPGNGYGRFHIVEVTFDLMDITLRFLDRISGGDGGIALVLAAPFIWIIISLAIRFEYRRVRNRRAGHSPDSQNPLTDASPTTGTSVNDSHAPKDDFWNTIRRL